MRKGMFLRWLAIVVVLLAAGKWAQACKHKKSSKTNCTNLPGVTTGNGSKKGAGRSGQPVRYMDGVLLYQTPSVAFPSVGGSFSFYLTYNNRPVASDSWMDAGVGYNWEPSIPKLSIESSTELHLVLDSHTVCGFEYDGQSKYLGQDGEWAYIEERNGDFVLVGTNGGEATFFGTGNSNRGKIRQSKSPWGDTWTFTYEGGSDGMGGTKLSGITEPSGVGWTFEYMELNGRLSKVTASRGSTTLVEIELEYYHDSTNDGVPGDLKEYKIIEKGNGTDIERTYHFRYYKAPFNQSENPGTDHDLRLVVGPMAAAWAVYKEENATTFDDITADTLIGQKYFDLRVEYDISHRVVEEEVRNGGSCSCGGGSATGVYSYSYQVRGGSPGGDYYNWPKYAVQQTNPDNTVLYVETNEVGGVISKVLVSGSEKWAWVNVYDDYGQVTEVYHPSACDAGQYS